MSRPHQDACLLPRSLYLSGLSGPTRAPAAPRHALAASAVEAGGSGLTNLLLGPLLQCMEAATLGMPFEARPKAGSAEVQPQK
jgi:hypothetical protein